VFSSPLAGVSIGCCANVQAKTGPCNIAELGKKWAVCCQPQGILTFSTTAQPPYNRHTATIQSTRDGPPSSIEGYSDRLHAYRLYESKLLLHVYFVRTDFAKTVAYKNNFESAEALTSPSKFARDLTEVTHRRRPLADRELSRQIVTFSAREPFSLILRRARMRG
jgi:hypothetical protein